MLTLSVGFQILIIQTPPIGYSSADTPGEVAVNTLSRIYLIALLTLYQDSGSIQES